MMYAVTALAIVFVCIALALVVGWLAFKVGVLVGQLQARAEHTNERVDRVESRMAVMDHEVTVQSGRLANRIDSVEQALVRVVTLELPKLKKRDATDEVAIIEAKGAVEGKRVRGKAAMRIVGAFAIAALTVTLTALGVPMPPSWHLGA